MQSIAVGDFNGDGRPDLVAADAGTNSVSVLLGNGNGTFQSAVSYAAGSQPIFVAVADFIGTGRTDLAVSNFTGGNMSVLIGTPAPPTAPHIAMEGVFGAGLSTPAVQSLSSNAIATVFGDAFAPAGTFKVVGSDDLVIGRLPTMVNGVCVYVNNVIEPLFFLNPNQINFQVRQVPAGATVPVQVATACGTANEVRSPVQPVKTSAATPEFFYFTHTADAKVPLQH